MRKNVNKLSRYGIAAIILVLAFFAATPVKSQLQQKIVGNTSGPASFSYGPVYRNTGNTGQINYSRHAYLYTAAELGIPAGCKIMTLEWLKKDTTRILAKNTLNVWVGNTNMTELPKTGSWSQIALGTSKVFSNNEFAIAGGANTYQVVDLSKTGGFVYAGGNLKVLVDWTKQGQATGAVNFYYLGAPSKALGTASTAPLTDNSVLTASTFGNNRPTLRISYVKVENCSGAPDPGNIVSSSAVACPGTPFTLSLQNKVPGNQISYQWQSSDDPSFSNARIVGNLSTATVSQAISKYYRCLVTCEASGEKTYSSQLFVPMNKSYDCLCLSTAVSTAGEDIIKFTFGNYQNCSACMELAPGPGSSVSTYSNFKTTPAIPIKRGVRVPFSVEISTCNAVTYPNRTSIFMDLNRNGLLTDPGELVYYSPTVINGAHTETGFITIPDWVNDGLLGLRIITVEQNPIVTDPCLVYNWGETEDYLVDVQTIRDCGLNPGMTVVKDVPGSCDLIKGSYEVCKGSNVTLGLSNDLTSNGIGYQWYCNSVAISGATDAKYTTPAMTSSKSYYCVVSCNNNEMSSVPINISLKSFLYCYCGSSAMNQAEQDILSVSIGEGINESTCTEPAKGPGSTLNMYSNFTTIGVLDDIAAGGNVPFSIYVDECDIPPAPYYAFGAAIWIDFNQNGSFADPGERVFAETNGELGPRTISGEIQIPSKALKGKTMLRIIAGEGLSVLTFDPCLYYGFGETEDYIINIVD